MPKRQVFLIMVNAKEFFESAPKQTAVPFIVSRFVRSGDTAVFNTAGLNVKRRVERDGWYLPKPYYMVTDNAPDDLQVQVQHFKLPEDVKVQRVAKGAPYPIDIGFGLMIVGQGTAECDGYLLIEPENRFRFFEEAAYDAIFGDQKPVDGQQILIAGNPIGCVVLEKDTTFQFVAGDFLATAGMVLYENPSDPDGYTVTPQMGFFQDYLILR